MNEFEHRLERTLLARAETVTAGPRLSGDEMVAAGRTARRRRRRATATAIAAGALAAVVGAGVLAQARSVGTGPVPPASDPPVSAAPTVFASVPAPVPAGAVGVSIMGLDRIVTPEGRTVLVRGPAGFGAIQTVRVPGGWVMLLNGVAAGEEVSQVWYQADGRDAVRVGELFGHFAVSRDGRRVASNEGDGARVAVYELPSLRGLGSIGVSGGVYPVGLGGDWVVMAVAGGTWRESRAYAWNTATGALVPTEVGVDVWGVSRDGRVLRRVAGAGPEACVDLVPIAELAEGRGAWCSADLAADGMTGALAPDGAWIALHDYRDGHDERYWVDAAGIGAGTARPVPIGIRIGMETDFFWDTDGSFVASNKDQTYRCQPTRPCQPLIVPRTQATLTLFGSVG